MFISTLLLITNKFCPKDLAVTRKVRNFAPASSASSLLRERDGVARMRDTAHPETMMIIPSKD